MASESCRVLSLSLSHYNNTIFYFCFTNSGYKTDGWTDPAKLFKYALKKKCDLRIKYPITNLMPETLVKFNRND